MTTKRVSTSELKVYKRCREEHRISYPLGVRPVARPYAFRFGTVFHAGLETWWTTRSVHAALAHADEVADKEDLGVFERATVEALLIGYDARWAPTADEYETISVEEGFRLLRPGPYELVGYFDGRVRHIPTRRNLVLEHKTTSEEIDPSGLYFRKLAIDDQIGLYIDAAESLGWTTDGVLYDVIRKPTLKPHAATPADKRKYRKTDGKLHANQREHDENRDDYADRLVQAIAAKPDAYFRRYEAVRLESERERARRDIDRLAHEILNVHPEEPQPRTPDNCRRYGRMCPYFDVCTGTAELTSSRFVWRE